MTTSHLTGLKDLTSKSVPLGELTEPASDGWDLGEIDVIHVNHEISCVGLQSTIPPALNPSNPPHLSWLVYQVRDSELGAFTLAQTRVGCRIGVKPRGMLVSAVCDNPAVTERLTQRWGFLIRVGEITVDQGPDRVQVIVATTGQPMLELDIVEMASLDGANVPIASGLNVATTEHGLRLVQIDPDYLIRTAHRGRPVVRSFDSARWGDPDILPTLAISGTFMKAAVTLPRIRFLIDPVLPPREGTLQV